MNPQISKREDWTYRHWKTLEWRQRCLVYLRVMGYYSNIDLMNIGKKSEAISRLNFSEAVALSNNKFKQQYE